jgi:MerR HTH family regulatory protein
MVLIFRLLLTLDCTPDCMISLWQQTIKPETMMQIGEIAKRTCLTVDAIRFYEKRKLLPRAVRSAGRFRLYGESSVERLHFIQQMQGLVSLCAKSVN